MEDFGEFLRSSSKDPQVHEFALRLVSGTKDLRPELDVTLARVARNWDLRRMATIDRNLLRMAIFELLYCDDIPPKVSINEAIELGKKYSTANSGAFVNGILDRVKSELANHKPREPQHSNDTSQGSADRKSSEHGSSDQGL